MSAQHVETGDAPVIPRPDRTPAALRAACAVIASHFLGGYDHAKEQAPASALEQDSIKPVHAYLAHWAALIETERHPEAAKAYHQAEYLAHIATTPDEARGTGTGPHGGLDVDRFIAVHR